MEAPTPVSAFLHSATMVQGGVYLLMRLSPALSGTTLWTGALAIFGGVTLLWGGIAALRQTDMKMMLAHTTIASLGLLVLLVGVGSEVAITAAVVYFLAHALYKAGLFLVTGVVDNGTGTRDITGLGGLRDHMALSFIAAVLVGASMLGVPPLLGYFAKEEMYLAIADGSWAGVGIIAVLIVGNGLLGAVAFATALKPYMGVYIAPPKPPREGSLGLLAGPVVFGAIGIATSFVTSWFAAIVVAPAASAVADNAIESGLHLGIDLTSIVFWLSVLTWLIGALLYWRLDRVRATLRRVETAIGWTFDRGFDALMFGLIRFAASLTRGLHHGRLELYLVLVFVILAFALIGPLLVFGGMPELTAFPELTLPEWTAVAIAVLGTGMVVLAASRLFAILSLGVVGLAVALLYLLFGAPDLSFTQFMVEVLSVVILTLVMTRLRLNQQDPREFEDLFRDGSIAVLCGIGLTLLLWAVLNGTFDPRLGDFFNSNSAALAHGRNAVNVVIVDFRGLDTLGEITVVMTAGIAILTLLRRRRRT
jgi:multicomponent Na+:H+ antiporter subunit A